MTAKYFILNKFRQDKIVKKLFLGFQILCRYFSIIHKERKLRISNFASVEVLNINNDAGLAGVFAPGSDRIGTGLHRLLPFFHPRPQFLY